MYACPDWTKVGGTQPCGFCLYMPLTEVIWCIIVGVPGMDLASALHPGQYVINLDLNLIQNLL